MIYKDIIGLNELFKPYYDLTQEDDGFWKTFIPNKQFYKVLRETLLSIESKNQRDRLSLWMQGNYGTGKSFATAVIKNLLYNNLNDTAEFIDKIEDEQLKFRLKNFRNQNKAFPVVLKGTGEIRDNTTFSLEIEKAVKKALTKENISISTQTDFERMIEIIENNQLHMDWNSIIENNIVLKMYVSNKEELLEGLRKNDKTLLLKLEELSSKTGIHFSHTKIDDWLLQVLSELKSQEVANNLIIYWDEFTSILEMQNSGLLLSKLQDIAELSVSHNLFLFIVSHRSPEQAIVSSKDMKKVLGRFNSFEYEMETITNYHLISSAIKKKDHQKWLEVKENSADDLREVIIAIAESEGSSVSNMIKDLFPIHPYTAYLSTFVSRNIGSAERSIFKFLNDDKKGFVHFINKNPNTVGEKLLTAEYLFDFFFDDFRNSESQRFMAVIDKYNISKVKVESESKMFFKVFKTVLLLNILYRYADNVEKVKPNEKNLRLIFSATSVSPVITEATEFLHKNQIIGKNPDGLFLVESSALPVDEVLKSQENLRQSYKSITKILDNEQRYLINQELTATIFRANELIIFDIPENMHIIKSKLKKSFHNSFKINIVLFIAMDYSELESVKNSVNELLQDDSFTNIIYIIPNEIFDNETFLRFIDYHAQAHVAGSHNLDKDKNRNLDFAKKVVSQWTSRFLTGSIDWFIRLSNANIHQNLHKEMLSDFSNSVNNDLMNKIFTCGVNKIKNSISNKNIWKPQISKAIAESYLFSNNLEELENKTKSSPSKFTREIIKNNDYNYIVKPENLAFKNGVNQEHPLRIMNTKIKASINANKGEVFNLGKVLSFLTKPPFGVYSNMIHFATIAFLLRSYIGKLYEAGTGRPIEKEVMREKVVNLFEFWSDKKNAQKLEVRLGTVEEKKLIEEMCDIFGIEIKDSLNDVKWAIRSWIKDKLQYPIWVYSYKEGLSEEIGNAIGLILIFLESIDTKFSHEEVKETLEIITDVQLDLKQIFKDCKSAKMLFITRVKKFNDVIFEPNEENEILEFIRKRMPEEIGVDEWKEDKVENIVKDWSNKKLREMVQQSKDNELDTDIYISKPIMSVEIKETFNHKIDNFQGDFKTILKRIGDEHNEFIAIIEKYLD